MPSKHDVVRSLLADSHPEPAAPMVEGSYVHIRPEEDLEALAAATLSGKVTTEDEKVSLEEAGQGHNVPFKTNEIGTQVARVGIRMPKDPGKPADLRPIEAVDDDGTVVGYVKADTVVVQDKNEIVGANPKREFKYQGFRTTPDGVQNYFDTEAEAKKFVAQGRSVTWKKSTVARPERALEAKKKGKAANPWAVCTAQVGRENKEKYERCVQGVKAKHPIRKESREMSYDLRPAKIKEGQEHSVIWITIQEMRSVCRPCAAKMENRGLSRIKIAYTEGSNSAWVNQIRAGRFTSWCKRKGFAGANKGCMKEALASKDAAVRSLAEAVLREKKLTSKTRKAMDPGSFVYPKERKYPIPDLAHGRNALARVSAHGSATEKKKVRAAVYRKFPGLKKRKEERED